jgi:hypothetical protein
MRTSGNDSDMSIVIAPVLFLLAFVMIWLGGPSEFMQAVNSIAGNISAWIMGLFA